METSLRNVPSAEDQFCYRVYCIQRELSKFFSNILRDFNLTYTQYVTLLILWNEKKPLTMTELNERLQVDCGTTSPLFKRMGRNNLVIREHSSDDRRNIYIKLTENGRKKEKAVQKRVNKCLFCVSESPDEHKEDVEMIAKMQKKFKKANDYLEDYF